VAGTITLTVDGGTALTPLSLSIDAGGLTIAGQTIGTALEGDLALSIDAGALTLAGQTISAGLTGGSEDFGRIFFDDFEDGTTDAWLQDSPHAKGTVVTSSTDGVAGPYAGTYMWRANYDGSSGDVYDSLRLPTIDYTSEYFIRARLRVDQNFAKTAGSAAKIMRVYYWDGTTYHDLFGIIRTGTGLNNTTIVDGTGPATYWGDASGDEVTNTSGWHKVEYYVNTGSGLLKVWHDGVLVRNLTGLDFGSVEYQPFYLTSNFSDSHDSTNHIYFDNVEVYSDAATGGTGSMSNATAGVT
jgi:hypothetical protein